ncbi:MAG: aldo/keto reductase [Planctomycetota bacterium]
MPRFPSRAAPPTSLPTSNLNTGAAMPRLGLGLYGITGDAETEACVLAALEAGYRVFDTASVYGNERGLGRALRRSRLPRSQYFVTTKLWNDHVRSGRIAEALQASLNRLQLDYVDLYLVHWPIPGRIVSTWQALESLMAGGRIGALGVSNHMISDLEELLTAATVVPAVNQIEHHPYLQSRKLVDFCRAHGIAVQAWSPLMRGSVLDDPMIRDIAGRVGKSEAQVVLRWHLQRELAAVVKTARPRRMRENAAIQDFALADADMDAIATLDRGERCGPDPRNFDF